MLEELATLLRSVGVMTLRELGIEDDVISGKADVALADLQMDSLASMEFCIGLDTQWGFVVTPDELSSIGTLGQLATLIGAAREH